MSAEEWRPLPWAVGRYEVSNLGRVRSLLSGGRILRTRPDANGYPSVELRPELGVPKNVRVHRLVLEAFVSARPAGLHARHLNGDPADNRLMNLTWGTPLENAADTRLHGTHNNGRKTHCKNGHEFTEGNTFRDRRGNRECRICRRAYFAARDAARRMERAS